MHFASTCYMADISLCQGSFCNGHLCTAHNLQLLNMNTYNAYKTTKAHGGSIDIWFCSPQPDTTTAEVATDTWSACPAPVLCRYQFTLQRQCDGVWETYLRFSTVAQKDREQDGWTASWSVPVWKARWWWWLAAAKDTRMFTHGHVRVKSRNKHRTTKLLDINFSISKPKSSTQNEQEGWLSPTERASAG